MSANNKLFIQAKPLNFSQKVLPCDVFSHFSQQPWAMWLDSCTSEHVDSRYDILVWLPKISIVTTGANTQINYFDEQQQLIRTENSHEDPFSLLKNVQKAFFNSINIVPHSIPFLAGALGYFSYDLGRRIEKLSNIAEHDIDIPEMAMAIYDHALVYDNKEQQFYLVCLDEKREQLEQFLQQQLSSSNALPKPKFTLTSPWQANITKTQYQDKFDQIQHYLLTGDCYQINLTQRFSSQYQGDEFLAYLALREKNQAPFSAFIRLDDHAILSISPERFLKLSHQKVQSKPIKGTTVRSVDPIIDQQNALALQHSTKDKAENLMIVDLLRNDISKVCLPGSVKVPKLFDVESFPAVHHLVSTVEGELSGEFDASDLLRAAFPGGSITGAPKIRAMEIIDELEPQRRSIYCGSIGYISACGNMDTNITIRTLVCQNNLIHCWAGGGIVADSNIDAEYQESLDKVNKILPILAEL